MVSLRGADPSTLVAMDSKLKYIGVLILFGGGMMTALFLNGHSLRFAADTHAVSESIEFNKSVIEIIEAYDYSMRRPVPGYERFREDFIDGITRLATQGNLSLTDTALLFSKGIEEAEKTRRERSHDIRNEIFLGKLYHLRYLLIRDEEDLQASIAAYSRALEAAPRYPSSSLGLAEAYLAAGEPGRAKEVVEALYETMDPFNVLVYTVLQVNVRAGDLEGGVRHIERLLGSPEQVGPLGVDEMTSLAVESLRVPDPRGREHFLEVVLGGLKLDEPDFQGTFAHIYFALAKTKAELGKREEAEKYAELAAIADPRYKERINEFIR